MSAYGACQESWGTAPGDLLDLAHPDSHSAGIAANLAPELLRQKEEDARISQEDADMEQLMALGMGPARVGTHEEEVCAAMGAMLLMRCWILTS